MGCGPRCRRDRCTGRARTRVPGRVGRHGGGPWSRTTRDPEIASDALAEAFAQAWTEVLEGSSSVCFADPSIGFAGEGHALLKTTNGGSTWTKVFEPPVLSGDYLTMVACPSPQDVWYFVRMGQTVMNQEGYVLFRSTDDSDVGGGIWFFDELHGLVAVSGMGEPDRILETEDVGRTWTQVSTSAGSG